MHGLSPEQKAVQETENTASQLEYLRYLVVELGISQIRDSHIQELHRLAIDRIYNCGGQYRDAREKTTICESSHTVPEAARVHGELVDLLQVANDSSVGVIERAAYALWRFNWLHPFRGGNGRTARAFTYLIFCIDYCRSSHFPTMFPGSRTIPTYICERRDEYFRALQAADEGAILHSGDPRELIDTECLRPMCTLIVDAAASQLESA